MWGKSDELSKGGKMGCRFSSWLSCDSRSRDKCIPTIASTTYIETELMQNRRVMVSKLWHDLSMTHGTVSLSLSLAYTLYRLPQGLCTMRPTSTIQAQGQKNGLCSLICPTIHQSRHWITQMNCHGQCVGSRHIPEAKCFSIEGKHSGSPRLKKFKMATSACKEIVTTFWDQKKHFARGFHETSTTIHAVAYCNTLQWW